MKVSDYIAEFIASLGVRHVFLITGGAVAHIVDSIARCPGLSYVCSQHEQASAMAADAYARIAGPIGVAVATSGPGATNLLTGICCSYTDSVPVLYITGQVSTFRLRRDSGVRQLGFQEVDTVAMARPVTKYAVLVEDPSRIRYELEKAVSMARGGRPGPVLVDVPDDVSRMDIDAASLPGYSPAPEEICKPAPNEEQCELCYSILSRASRPVVVFGAGVRLSGGADCARFFAKTLSFPVALTWAAKDLFPYDNPLVVDGFGITGTRAGNFIVQNADCILSIGSRLDTHATGSPVNTFGRNAKKIIVDIDGNELGKFARAGIADAVLIRSDALEFMNAMLAYLLRAPLRRPPDEWTTRIAEWHSRYPVCPGAGTAQTGCVDPYDFIDRLSSSLSGSEIIISDTGNTVAQTFQAFRPNGKQRMITAFNNTPMGYAVAAAVGAAFASPNTRVICITGDGGLQMNIQELATIRKYGLPVSVVCFNNRGYGMIRQTQDDWLEGRHEASAENTGVAVPDFSAIAAAYGLESVTVNDSAGVTACVRRLAEGKGAYFAEVMIAPGCKTVPMLKAGRPIEDPNPLLDRKEFMENMVVEPMEISRR